MGADKIIVRQNVFHINSETKNITTYDSEIHILLRKIIVIKTVHCIVNKMFENFRINTKKNDEIFKILSEN